MPPALPLNPHLAKLAQRALVTAGPVVASAAHATHHYEKRGLSVNHTQGVTLGVIGAYVVVIALLWNLPYVRWVLWPFKVCDYFFVLEVGKKMVWWEERKERDSVGARCFSSSLDGGREGSGMRRNGWSCDRRGEIGKETEQPSRLPTIPILNKVSNRCW